jgi:predicted 2-oxoglutarate/Fe(II)-dependent dioxygenase YbiX
MINPNLAHALGTRHCPHCHFPLFANPYAPVPNQAPGEEQWPGDFILLIRSAFPAPRRLLECAECLPFWARAAVVGDGEQDTSAEHAKRRGNDRMSISGLLHPDLVEFEQMLRESIHSGVARYLAVAGSIRLSSDLGFELLRYGPGQGYSEHVDSMPGSSSIYGQRLLSAVLYLNDDFEGGELHFSRQGLTYNPEAGSLVVFPSNFCFPHSSQPVLKGNKYAVVTWFV